MKLLFTLCALVVLPLPVLADEKPTKEEVVEYFEVTNSRKVIDLYAKSYMAMLGEDYPELGDDFYGDPDFEKAIKAYKQALFDQWVEITRKHLNRKDLKELTEFLKTDLGKKMLKLHEDMDPDFVAAGEVVGRELNEAIEKLLEKYIDG